MGHKSFKTASGLEKISFDLEGLTDKGKPWSEHFTCNGAIPAGIILEFGVMTSGEDGEPADAAASVRAVQEFFRAALHEDDYTRYEALIIDPKRIVDLATLMEVAGWLAGEYSRPTHGEQSSPISPANLDGTVSKDGVPQEISTFSRPNRATRRAVPSR
jgi:hypothetical protein